MKEETKCYCGHTTYCDCGLETLEEAAERLKGKELFKESNDRARKILSEIKSLPIQETLEEVAKNYAKKWNDLESQFKLSSCFIAGAMWQQKRSYSEEEVEDFIYKVCGTVARLQGITLNGNHIDTAYKQFKKNQIMKNIHILPTSQPSRLYQLKNDILRLDYKIDKGEANKHIYITSDEEIKEGDWTLMFDDLGNLFLCDKPQQYLGIEKGHHLNKGLRKIILTTDQDLIADGVQAINNEFLEWFVQNPSCEAVKVIDEIIEDTSKDYIIGLGQPCTTIYKIIIPKEEPKQETLEELIKQFKKK